MLGQFEVRRDGAHVELGGLKQRAVLAVLLLDANRVVSLDRLVDSLWPDEPPNRAIATVQVFVSNLRRALEPERQRGTRATVLTSRAPGYLLAIDPTEVDAHIFESLAEEGHRELADGNVERAAGLLSEALGLWRGPALAEFAAEPFAHAEAARLEEVRLGCQVDLYETALLLGRHQAVVAELEQFVARHPLRERPRAQLMLALYRAGRQAQALVVARAGRRVLADELGLDPGAPLRDLEEAILRQDPELDWNPPPSGPARGRAQSREYGDAPGRILVVDDSAINRRLLVAALRELGHDVVTAENGRKALELLAEDPDGYDLILLDLFMPVMDGFEALSAVKEDTQTRHLPVIMVSAVHEMESVIRCIELGAADYVTKPFGAEMLRARVRASLAAKRIRDAEMGDLARMTAAMDQVKQREDALRAEIEELRRVVGSGA